MMATMFKQLAFAIIFSQTASLITTFLIVPMLSSRIKDVEHSDKCINFAYKPFQKLLDKFYVFYDKTLRVCLKNKKKFIAVPIALFILSLVVLSKLGMTLMASSDEGALSVSIECPQGTKLEDTDTLVRDIEKIIHENKEVEYVSTTVGSGGGMESALGTTSGNAASITVTLVDKTKRKKTTDDVVQEIRESLKNVTGATITVDASSSSMSASSDEIKFDF